MAGFYQHIGLHTAGFYNHIGLHTTGFYKHIGLHKASFYKHIGFMCTGMCLCVYVSVQACVLCT